MKALYLVTMIVLTSVITPVRATILFHAGLGEPPPAELSGIPLTEFGLDDRPLRIFVPSIPSPLGGEITTDSPHGIVHGRVGDTWAYTDEDFYGELYQFYTTDPFTLFLPPGTTALRTSIATNRDGFPVSVEMRTQDGQVFHHYAPRYGAGAHWVGFAVSDPSSEEIRSIRFNIGWAGPSVLGRLAIARVPEPATLALLLLGCLVPRRR